MPDLRSSRTSISGCEKPLADCVRSAASSAILAVYAAAWVARSIAFLNRAVAISSIVRVILRMLRTALRRFRTARAFAMVHNAGQVFQPVRSLSGTSGGLDRYPGPDRLENLSYVFFL